MAPKSPWNKKSVANANILKAAATEQVALPVINYAEVQAEEVEVLEAIYMEDFEDVEIKTAWSKTTDRSFKLKLRAFSDANSMVLLSVLLTATYPKTAPILEIADLNAFHERTQKRIRNVVTKRPNQLLGEVMIHVIASEIQDALEDAVQARQQGTLPSLEDERASAEEVATALAKEAEEAEVRRQREAQEEEDRVLKQMVDEEIHRREKRKPLKSADSETFLSTRTSSEDDMIKFDQPATLFVHGEATHFDTVRIVSRDGDTCLGTPLTINGTGAALLVVRRLTLAQRDRDELMEIESVLDAVRDLRHPNLQSLIAYRIENLTGGTHLTICTEHDGYEPIEHMLAFCGTLQVEKARQLTIQLIEAIDECHRNGVVHGNIAVDAICIIGKPSAMLKLTKTGYGRLMSAAYEKLSPKWRPPEGMKSSSLASQRKADIWDLGIVILQMFLGLDVLGYPSPQSAIEKLPLSEAFADLVRKIFNVDPTRRPSAFDLLPAEFLRSTSDALEGRKDVAQRHHRLSSSNGFSSPLKRRSRHNSSNVFESTSRYVQDFTEIGRLGKGGFGEVVKARNKLDGGIYAIKKISRAPQLDQILSEVMLLNRLNHPYVVRYYSTWVETGPAGIPEEATSVTEDTISDGPRIEFGYQSTGGLDFVSSSDYPQIQFGEDSDSDDGRNDSDGEAVGFFHNGSSAVDSTDSSDTESRPPPKTKRSDSRRVASTLYIQMEYCERHTLRDLIRKELSEDEAWRYVRQITEGLSHIHNHGIIHRDLKPDNVFIDVAGNPKIGDFGLATTSQYQVADATPSTSSNAGGDMTRSVGTALYVAPELRSSAGTTYNDKVDMYSLGVMFFEMCEPFSTAMERIRALQQIREKNHTLPPAYEEKGEKASQGRLIECLISHKPSERPSSTELLRSNILPLKIEDETIRQALNGLSDPRSPYHQKMMSALFAHDQAGGSRVKALAWDAKDQTTAEDTARIRARATAKDALETVFRRHGGEEWQRECIFPRSGYYTAPNVVQLLDASGNLVQLPFDLTLPNARLLSRREAAMRCMFTFGHVYRDTFSGGPPRSNEEVDFDIISLDKECDLAFDDAEIIRVIDEFTEEIPHLINTGSICFHINHATILDTVLEFCRVPASRQAAVKECISKLGYHQFTWAKIRGELRSPAIGLPVTTVDEMQHFDFRDTPEKVFAKLRELTQSGSARLAAKLDRGIQDLQAILRVCSLLKVRKRIYVAPLGSFNAKFYENGMLVQCVHDRKTTRDVIAAGGRYDALIQAHRTVTSACPSQGAVGVSIGLDRLVTNMVKNTKASQSSAFTKESHHSTQVGKRCDVLLVAGTTEAVRMAAYKLLASLWGSGIGIELAANDRDAADEERYRFVVTLRHEASTTVRVRTVGDEATESDIPVASLVTHLQQEIREREGGKLRIPILARQPSHQDNPERKGNVQVLMSQHRSKKSNKYHIVEAAQQRWAEKLDQWKEAPILAIETRDDVMDLLQETRLGDVESWRKVVQSVQLNERQYLQQVQDILGSWRKKWTDGDGVREACLFNFRTGHCIYYDVGL